MVDLDGCHCNVWPMDEPRKSLFAQPETGHWRAPPRPGDLLAALALVGLTIAVGMAIGPALPASSMPLLFLLAVLMASARYGFWTGITASILAFLAENYFFIEPHFTFHVSAVTDWLSLVVLLIAGATTGFLVGRLREEADAAQARAHSLTVMGHFATGVANASDIARVMALLVQALQELEGGKAIALVREGSMLRPVAGLALDAELSADDIEALDKVLRRGGEEKPAAPGWTSGRYSFRALGEGGGVIGYTLQAESRPEFDRARTALCDQANLALRNLALVHEAAQAKDKAQREELRAALLSSLSHDLRTPLATILGGISSLRELGDAMPQPARQDTLQAVEEETERLSRYVSNLLHLTRLKAGIALRLEWVDGADVVNGAVARARRSAPARQILVDRADPLPLVHVDAVLLEQALFNLIENALKFSPASEAVTVSLASDAAGLLLSVTDRGPGIPAAEQAQIFEPFFRGEGQSEGGAGLGLAITRGIVQALGGQVVVVSPVAEGRGTSMQIQLSLSEGQT